MEGKFVVIRCYNAGVHCGTLTKFAPGKVTLTDARRIWRWRGANTLNEVALNGVDKEYTRISEPVAEIILTEACEVIATTDKARENLTESRWAP